MVYTENPPELKMPKDDEKRDRHCGIKNCLCTHSEPCYKGWLDDAHMTAAVPCPSCRFDLSQVLKEIEPLGKRTAACQSTLRGRGKNSNQDDY